MDDIKISFIVPVFNSQSFLGKCIDSIIFQDYKNIELILVDDGSTDNSGVVCDDYANNFSFVKVIHKKNEGVAAARNCGLKECSGDYIFFIDNDDWIDSSELSDLVRKLKDGGVDLLINKYYIINNDKKCLGNGFIKRKFIENKKPEEVLKYFRKNRINIMAPWEYIVKRSVILKNNISFNSLQNGLDDSVFSATLFCSCESFAIGENPVYYWRQSNSSQGRNHKKGDFIEKTFSTFNDFMFFAKKFKEAERKKYIYFCMYKNIFSLFQFFNQYSDEERKKIKNFLIKNNKDIKKSARYSGGGTLYFFLYSDLFTGCYLAIRRLE